MAELVSRRPWTLEDIDAALVVKKDATGQKFAYVYYEETAGPAISGQDAQPRRGGAEGGQYSNAGGPETLSRAKCRASETPGRAVLIPVPGARIASVGRDIPFKAHLILQ